MCSYFLHLRHRKYVTIAAAFNCKFKEIPTFCQFFLKKQSDSSELRQESKNCLKVVKRITSVVACIL